MRYLAAIIFLIFTAFLKPAAADDFSLTCFHNTKPETANVSINMQLKFVAIERVRIYGGKAVKGNKSYRLIGSGGNAIWAQEDFRVGTSSAYQDTIALEFASANLPLKFNSMTWTKQSFAVREKPNTEIETYTCMAAETDN